MNVQALHDVIDSLEVLICGLDGVGRIHIFNRPCERLTGLERERAIGLNWLELFATGGRVDHVQELWSQTQDDAPAGPFEALCRNGRNLRWTFSRHDRGGPPMVVLWAVGVDITEEREALVRARELERVVTLGNMVSGLTHELRNPLNGALLQLTVVDRTLARHPDERIRPAVDAVAQAAAEIRRISRILDDFLVFTRPQPLHLERTDVRTVAASALERSSARAKAAGVKVSLETEGAVIAEIDPSRVETAIYQLVANAIDAAAAATEAVVSVRVAVAGNSVAIEVEDRGGGLPGTDAPLFEPFFTTKTGGTGLGLSIVERVATDHGGTIEYVHRSGATVFRLELPIVGGVAN